jgi:four helix bundle protein
VRDFQKLRVWRAAHQLALDTYDASKRFPPDERYGLTAQMRRAALSIPTNIAEGAGRPTSRDYRRFLSISLGSINELQSLIMAAAELEYLDPQQYQQLHDQPVTVRRMTLAFRNSLTDAP